MNATGTASPALRRTDAIRRPGWTAARAAPTPAPRAAQVA
jgi:hypothetical protein